MVKKDESVSQPTPLAPVSSDSAALLELAKSAEQGESEAREFMQPEGAPAKKKSGRHKKDCQCQSCLDKRKDPATVESGKQGAAPSDPQIPDFEKVDLKPALRMVFSGLSKGIVVWTKVPAVALSDSEMDELAKVWEPVAKQYAPIIFAKHGAIIAAGALTAGIGMRIADEVGKEVDRRKAARASQARATETVTELQNVGTLV